MEYERKRMLQTLYKFLEKIEDKLPIVLSYECRRLKESMNNMGFCPKYINMPDENPPQKTTLERRQRAPLTITKISPSTNTALDSTIKEFNSRPKSSLEICHNDKASSPINIPSPQVTPNCTGWKSSFSPNSNKEYFNMKFMNNETRKKCSSNNNIAPICKSPLPPTPTSPPTITQITSKEMQQSSYYNSPSIQSPKSTNKVKERPIAPKEPGLVDDNVTFFLGTSATIPDCYTQYDTKPHSYENFNANKPKDHPRRLPAKITGGHSAGYHPRNSEKRGMVLS